MLLLPMYISRPQYFSYRKSAHVLILISIIVERENHVSYQLFSVERGEGRGEFGGMGFLEGGVCFMQLKP